MLTGRHFRNFAFGWRLFDSGGVLLDKADGTLFSVPRHAQKRDSEEYLSHCSEGWSVCPSGYAVYCMKVEFPNSARLVFPGLKVHGVSKVSGVESVLSIKIERGQFEQYLNNAFRSFREVERDYYSIIRDTNHEIRALNTALYNAAIGARDRIDELENLRNEPFQNLKPLVLNVIALSEILSSRANVLDAVANPTLATAQRGRIGVYQKFDKICKCMKTTAKAKEVDITINGSSFGRIDGYEYFDVIPFLLIENAVKYSPPKRSVDVSVREDQSKIYAEVSSIGPQINSDELQRIYEPGYRGRCAQKLITDGSGIGMYVVRDFVERKHKGKIELQQSEPSMTWKEIPHCLTKFKLEFDRAIGN